MLWTIRHEWPSGAWFAFNCYRHWATLVIRGKGGTVVLIFSKEGVTQGDPLSMFGYGIGILPLIHKLKLEFPAVKQPWYADDAGAGISFTDLRTFFLRLQELGPTYGYFPEPSKSILIVRAHNRTRAKSSLFQGANRQPLPWRLLRLQSRPGVVGPGEGHFLDQCGD
jgi:hypothetical protein